MEEQQIEDFIEKVKKESTYKKFIKMDIIEQLITIFDTNPKKGKYPKTIKNPLKIALNFYKDYNPQYYEMIIEGIKHKKIIISKDQKKSFVDTKNNAAFIALYGNDGDLFMLTHEFAHFIDRNSNPVIIPDKYWFLAETFAFFMEKKLEIWLDNKKYEDLINTKRNNRIYFETKMLETIKNELYYEKLYIKNGRLFRDDISTKKLKAIMKYDIVNLVNNLLSYPIANILSDYFITNNLIHCDNEFVLVCLNINLYEILKLKACKESKTYKKVI